MMPVSVSQPALPAWPSLRPNELRTVRDWWRYAMTTLARHQACFGQGTTCAAEDAAFLVLGALALPLGTLDPFADAALTSDECDRLHALLERRVRERIPTAYVLGFTELMGVRFEVDPSVLIPRSYVAELLVVDEAPWLENPPGSVLDLCTGSGCIAVLAARAFPQARIVASDISADALRVAARNVRLHGLEDRIDLVQGDGLHAVTGQRFDLILCNPPYVTSASMAKLPPEFRHEPALALAAGEDGNAFLRPFFAAVASHLNPGGVVLVDVGHNRALVEAAFPDLPFTWLATEGAHDGVCMLREQDL